MKKKNRRDQRLVVFTSVLVIWKDVLFYWDISVCVCVCRPLVVSLLMFFWLLHSVFCHVKISDIDVVFQLL